jgi:cobalt-zinc-cadmium efflux system outer membrane protein
MSFHRLVALVALVVLASPTADAAPPALTAPAPPDVPAAALTRAEVERAVLAHSPTLEAMLASLEAAQARADAAGRWPSPELDVAIAPRTFAAGDPPAMYRVGLRQPIGPFGMRGAQALGARADAEGVSADVAATRLDLLREARVAFAEYRRAEAGRAVHRAMVDLAAQIRQVALVRYASGKAEQADPLAAGVEAARLTHHAVMLDSEARVAAARLNALMGRPARDPLPPPSDDDGTSTASGPDSAAATPDLDLQLELARAERPELRGATSRVAGRVALRRAAAHARWPGLSLGVGYDRFMDEPTARAMVELGVELPLFSGRGAEERAASAEVAQAEADRAGLLLRVDREVTEAAARSEEATHELEVVDQGVLPAATQAVAAARTAYEGGRGSMSALLDALRSLVEARLDRIDARARQDAAWADLARAIGQDVGGGMGDMK